MKNIFDIDIIYNKISTYLDLKETMILGLVSINLLKFTEDNYTWHSKNILPIIKNNSKNKYISYYLSKFGTRYCLICLNYIYIDFYIGLHKCLSDKKCQRCNIDKCNCSDLIAYHKECVEKYNRCNICDKYVSFYHINLNV